MLSVNADLPFIIGKGFKLDLASDQGKNRVIPAQANIITRMDFGASLPDYDGTGQYLFSIKSFHAQSLSGTIPAIRRAASALFMSHLKSPLLVFVCARQNDIVDCQPGVFLAMTTLFGVMVFMLESENDDFITFNQTFGSSHDFGPLNSRSANSHFFIISYQQDFIQLDLVTFSLVQEVYVDRLARSDFILFTTGFKNSVNGTPPLTQQLFILADLEVHMQLAYAAASLTSKIGRSPCRSTFSATLPKAQLAMGDLPRVAITTRSAWVFFSISSIS